MIANDPGYYPTDPRSPLFLTTVGLTLVLVWMTLRLRSRMMGLVLSAMLMMTLTSFRPVGTPQESQNVGEQNVDEQNVDDGARRASERNSPLVRTTQG